MWPGRDQAPANLQAFRRSRTGRVGDEPPRRVRGLQVGGGSGRSFVGGRRALPLAVGMAGAVVAFVQVGVPALTFAALLAGAGVAVSGLTKVFGPPRRPVDAATLAALHALPGVVVADEPVAGLRAVTVGDDTIRLLGVVGGPVGRIEDVTSSADYLDLVSRVAHARRVLAADGVSVSAVAVCVDAARFGPRSTDDGVVVAGLARLGKALRKPARATGAARPPKG